MRPFFSLLFALVFVNFSLVGQQRKIGWLTNLDGGYTNVLKGFNQVAPQNDFMYLKHVSAHFQFSTAVFFNEKWGVNVTCMVYGYENKNFSNFKSTIESTYPLNDYYVNYNFNSTNNQDLSTGIYSVGLAYMHTFKKIRIVPKFNVGIYEIDGVNVSVEIKKKNSNEFILMNYSQNNLGVHDFFLLQPAVNLVYQFHKNLGLNIEASYIQAFVTSGTLIVSKTTSTAADGVVYHSNTSYNQQISQLSFSIGLSYYFHFGKILGEHIQDDGE